MAKWKMTFQNTPLPLPASCCCGLHCDRLLSRSGRCAWVEKNSYTPMFGACVHGVRVRYSPGFNVNTPFSSTHKRNSGTVESLYSGTQVGTGSLCAHRFCQFQGNPALLWTPCEAQVIKWRLTGRKGVTMHTVSYRLLAQGVSPTQHHFVPVPRHWFPGLTPSVDSPLDASYLLKPG